MCSFVAGQHSDEMRVHRGLRFTDSKTDSSHGDSNHVMRKSLQRIKEWPSELSLIWLFLPWAQGLDHIYA